MAAGEPPTAGQCAGTADLEHWIEHWEHKASEGAGKLVRAAYDLPSFWRDFGARAEPLACARPGPVPAAVAELRTGATVSANIGAAFLGCDVGSPTAKAVQLDGEAQLLASFYDPSAVNPIGDAKALMRQARTMRPASPAAARTCCATSSVPMSAVSKRWCMPRPHCTSSPMPT